MGTVTWDWSVFACVDFARQFVLSELFCFFNVINMVTCCHVVQHSDVWIFPRMWPVVLVSVKQKRLLPYLELLQCYDNRWWIFQFRVRLCCQLGHQVNVGLFYLPLLDLCSVWLILPLCTDMPIFGQCPAQDNFYLVMCSHCGQVVKPQAFQAHYGKFHAHETHTYMNMHTYILSHPKCKNHADLALEFQNVDSRGSRSVKKKVGLGDKERIK